MHKNRLTIMLCLLSLAALRVGAAEFYAPPVVSVPLVATAPIIDGQIEPGEWSEAAVFSDFMLVGGAERPTLPTTVYVAHDASAVYLAAQLFDPNPALLRAEAEQRDGDVCADDTLQLFIDTAAGRRSYAHLAVNPLGTQYDALDEDVTEDFRWEAQAAVDDSGWVMELALPFANDIPPKPGDTWVLNIVRNATAVGEQSSWCRLQRTFGEPENFGTLIFGQRPFKVILDDMGALWLGENTGWASVQPLARLEEGESEQAAEWAVKVNVRVMGRDSRGHFFDSVKETVGIEGTQIPVSYTVKQDGLSTVTFSLTDHEGVVPWRSSPYPVAVPPVSTALRQAETILGGVLVNWAQLPAGPLKQAMNKELGDLLKAWEHVHKRYELRERMTREELEGLLAQVKLIKQQTEVVVARMMERQSEE